MSKFSHFNNHRSSEFIINGENPKDPEKKQQFFFKSKTNRFSYEGSQKNLKRTKLIKNGSHHSLGSNLNMSINNQKMDKINSKISDEIVFSGYVPEL